MSKSGIELIQPSDKLVALESSARQIIEQTNSPTDISQESFWSGFKDHLEKVSNFISDLFARSDISINLLNELSFQRNVQQLDYTAIRRYKVPVSQGLNTHFIDYIQTLSLIQREHLSSISEYTLEPLNKVLSRAISDPEFLESVRFSQELEKIANIDVEKSREKIQKHYARDMAEYRPYGDLIYRQADWNVLPNGFNTLAEELQKDSISKMLVETRVIDELIDRLIDLIDHRPDQYNITAEKSKELAILTHSAAENVEFHAGFRYLLQELGTSIEYIRTEIPKKHKQDN